MTELSVQGARVERFFTEVVPAAAVTASLALLGAAEAGLEVSNAALAPDDHMRD